MTAAWVGSWVVPLVIGSDLSAPGQPGGHVLANVRRPPFWSEVLVAGWLCWLYDVVNNLSPVREQVALSHAAAVLHVEQTWHLDPELVLNLWAGAHRLVGLALSDYYDVAHFVVTLGLVGWLWWRRPNVYRPLRNSLVLINLIGFAVFWLYPMAPPRMLTGAGFVDVVAVSHALGSWHSGTLASQANEFAAMPSLHIAWAVWSALAIWRATGRRTLRVIAVGYPLVTAVAVLATANHFLLDVVGGVLTTMAAACLAFVLAHLRRCRAYRRAERLGFTLGSSTTAGSSLALAPDQDGLASSSSATR